MIGERRRSALILAVILGCVTALCGWMLYDSVITFVMAVRAGAPTIYVGTGVAAIMLLWPAMLALSVLAIAEIFRDGHEALRLWSKALGLTLIVLPLSLAAPWLYRSWADDMLLRRGYRACVDHSRTMRFPAATYARSVYACPASDRAGR